MQNKFNYLLDRTVFITGSDKNAGKTTFLNLALEYLRGKTSLAYLTIGIDGEKSDQVFGTPKPRILSVENDYIVTTDTMLKESSGSFKVIEVFSDKTVLGRLVLAEVIRSGCVELVGAEDNSGLTSILEYLKKEKAIATILIDGAVNRVTQVSAVDNAAFVFVSKITPNNLNAAVEKLKIIHLVSKLPLVHLLSETQKAEYFTLKGALTPLKLKNIPEKCQGLIIEDFTRFFLSYEELKKLTEKMPVYLTEYYELLFFQVNNYDITSEQIHKTLKNSEIYEKIIFNPHYL